MLLPSLIWDSCFVYNQKLDANTSSTPSFIRQIWLAFWHPFQDRTLLRMFILRDLQSRYKNSWGGLFWLVIQPVILLSIYTVVFQQILGVKWGAQNSSSIDFALNLYLGLVVFNIFSESIQAAPTVLRNHSNLIKKIRFPIRILPAIPVGTALCDAVLGLVVWQVIYILVLGSPPISVLYLPLVLLPLILFVMGLCWIVASLSAYVRDFTQIIRFVVTALLFLSPIFFPLQSMPQDWQWILAFNPLAIEIEMLRGIMIGGITPAWDSYFGFLVLSLLVYGAGFYWFEFTSDGFVDVL